MTRDLNRYKKGNNKLYIKLLNEIKEGKVTNTIEYIFPLIHGLNISELKEYNFKNIIEAREYLNNDDCFNNVIDICKLLLKKDIETINNIFENNLIKLKSSITLFSYITNPLINNLLTFRNYDKNLIKKVFKERKEFTLFNKIIDKFFQGEYDKETILLIESEILEYSLRDVTLRDINSIYKSTSEDLLIKFSEISPLVTSLYKKREVNKKYKSFYSSLTDKEYLLFLKFNIKDKYKKQSRKYKHKFKEKATTLALLIITLLMGTSLNPIKESYSSTNNLISQISIDIMKEQNATTKKENEKLIEEQKIEEQVIIKEPEPIITNYPYITPTGSGNTRIVEIAASQIGNIGGEPYWSWYGFSGRVDWCGCFVSWVFNEAGLLGSAVPKFSIAGDGLNWFIRNKLFRDRNYIPRSGDLIFFDYNYDGRIEHVGIVDKVINGRVYTIEGNTNRDRCGQNSFAIGHGSIYGYGTPNY